MKSKSRFFKLLHQVIQQLFILFLMLVKELALIALDLKNRFVEKLRFSLTFKITIVYMSIIFRILILISILITAAFAAYLGWNAENDLQKDYTLVSGYLKESRDIPENKIKDLSELDNISISIFDENRNVIYTSEKEPHSVVFYDKNLQKRIVQLNNSYMLARDGSGVYVDWYHPHNINNNFGYALVMANREEWQSSIIYIQIKDRIAKETISVIILSSGLFVIDIFFLIMILFAGSRASRRTLRPIQTMTKTVENITINELGTRLDIRGSQDELKDLARTFNNMLDRIQQSYEQQNQFVSDASHELRTPISVIQGYANMLDRWGKDDKSVLEESITAIKTESENMKSLVEKLLFLARSDKNTQKLEKEEFYLNELIDEIIKESKLIDDSHEIKSEKNDSVKIDADRKLIKEALRVFVDNSIKYTPQGGTIKISSALLSDGVLISVEDTGVGIPKGDLPYIFDRFYRADKSRTKQTGGTGLGLAIAKWIINKHNGKINVESKVNVGTKIEVLLPLKV